MHRTRLEFCAYDGHPRKNGRCNKCYYRRKTAHRYGISQDEYERILSFGCAICGSTERMNLDHDHLTGAIRGALCNNCNRGIGMFNDRPDLMRNAASYLEQGILLGGIAGLRV
jgi:hypothetical protein